MEKKWCCLYSILLNCLLHLDVLFNVTTGALFDIQPLYEERNNYSVCKRLCQERGYDGLAVLSSPEAYAFAIKLKELLVSVLVNFDHLNMNMEYKYRSIVWCPTAKKALLVSVLVNFDHLNMNMEYKYRSIVLFHKLKKVLLVSVYKL